MNSILSFVRRGQGEVEKKFMGNITKKLIALGIIYFILTTFGCKVIKTKPDNMVNKQGTKSFYEFSMNSIDGRLVDFREYKGKKVLIVNVASECGYTPQYKDLQKLYDTYNDKLVILAFPANNFGGQEPGSNEEIKDFCEKNYKVTFPMFKKISVKGNDMHPLYKWLCSPEENGWNDKAPNWNFCKYLINENGELVKYYSFAVEPMSEVITSQIK